MEKSQKSHCILLLLFCMSPAVKNKQTATKTLDLLQVDSQNVFLAVIKISLNVFKITSAEGTRNKNKPSAEGAREP